MECHQSWRFVGGHFQFGILGEPVWYPQWGSIVELEVAPNKTPGLMTFHPYNTNVLQSITYAKSPCPPNISNTGQKKNSFDTSMVSPSRQRTVFEFGRSRHKRGRDPFVFGNKIMGNE